MRHVRRWIVGLTLGLLCTGFAVAPSYAADVQCSSTSCSGTALPENANVCTAPYFASSTTTSVELNGQVSNPAVNVRWHIWWSATTDFSSPTKVFTTSGEPKLVGIGATWDVPNSPSFPQYQSLFPGYFESCMNNYETGTPVDWQISMGQGQL